VRGGGQVSIADVFTGLPEDEQLSFEDIKAKREKMAQERSASEGIWKET